MATRNTPTTFTLEEWRVEFNELATDIGNVTGSSQGDQLTTSATDIVGAINELETNFNNLAASSTAAADNITTGDAAVSIATSSGDITLDTPTDIILDADGGDVFFKDGGTTFGSATNTSGNLIIKSGTTTALTFSGANVTGAGTYTGGGTMTTGGNIVIPDAGNIGSASDTDAIAISSGGVVTFSQAPSLTEIDSGSTITLDATTDIVLDANGGDIFFKDDGTTFGSATNTSGNLIIKSGTTTALTFSGANVTAAGTYSGGGTMTTGGNIVIPNAGNIGSASDTDAIAIASGGVVTFSQSPVFPDGSLAIADLDIDGGTDIGAALVDADLIVVDDGAGGTNRKSAMSRVKTYINASEMGTQHMWIPAAAMRPRASNGCASITDAETTSGRPDMQVLDFDASSDEHAQFTIAMPSSWNEGTITYQVYWTTTATDTDGVAWGLQGVCISDNDTMDVAYGTAVVVTDDALGAAEDLCVTAASSAVTLAGSPAAGDLAAFQIFRDVSDGNDDMAEDARLVGIKLIYTTNAATD